MIAHNPAKAAPTRTLQMKKRPHTSCTRAAHELHGFRLVEHERTLTHHKRTLTHQQKTSRCCTATKAHAEGESKWHAPLCSVTFESRMLSSSLVLRLVRTPSKSLDTCEQRFNPVSTMYFVGPACRFVHHACTPTDRQPLGHTW